MAEIKHPFAKDLNGNIVFALDAIPRTDYTCIGCGGAMRRRQGSKRAHFAHKVDTAGCSSESVLHLGCKELLFTRLKHAIDCGSELMMSWICETCEGTHQRNLIGKARGVAIETSYGPTRPDISLLDANGRPIIAIEIVVTHEPEESTIQYYKENKIALIKFKIESADDVSKLTSEELTPANVDVCLNPKCKHCSHHMLRTSLYIIKGECWRCKTEMNISAIIDSKYHFYSAEDYSREEIELANKYGANIEHRYSKMYQGSYAAHVCKKCNNICGQNFIFTDYIAPALYNQIDYEDIDIGYTCSCLKKVNENA